MPQLWMTEGLDLDSPDTPFVLVRFDADEGTPARKVLDHLGSWAYEGERLLYIIPADGWIERRIEGSTLTIDLVTYPTLIEKAGVDPGSFTEKSALDASAVRLLRASFIVDPAEYAEADDATYVWTTAENTSLEQIKQDIEDENDAPLVFAPEPAPADNA